MTHRANNFQDIFEDDVIVRGKLIANGSNLTNIPSDSSKVDVAGDTMTGALTISDNTTGTYNLLQSLYVPDLSSNQYVEFIIGKEESNYNRGTINFQYLSSGNTSNALNFGFYGVASAFKVQGNGDCTALRDLIATRNVEAVKILADDWTDVSITESQISDLGSYVLTTGDTMTGNLTLNGGDLILNEGDDIHWVDAGTTQQQKLIHYDIAWDMDSPTNIMDWKNTISGGTSPIIMRGLNIFNSDFATTPTSGTLGMIGVLVNSEFADLIEEGSVTRTYSGFAHTMGNVFDIGGTGNIIMEGFTASAGNLLNFGSGTWTGRGFKATGFVNGTLDVAQPFYCDGGDYVLKANVSSGRSMFKWGTGENCGIGYDGTDMVFDSQLVGSGHFSFLNGDIEVSDNQNLSLGTAQDALIFYNGTDLVINAQAVGSGDVWFPNDNQALDLGAGHDARIYYDGTDLVFNSSVAGSGTLKMNSANNWTANGTNTVTISNVAPAGVGTATISKWFTVKDNAGTVYYIPAWT